MYLYLKIGLYVNLLDKNKSIANETDKNDFIKVSFYMCLKITKKKNNTIPIENENTELPELNKTFSTCDWNSKIKYKWGYEE